MGHKVVILDDLSSGFYDQVPSQAEFVEGFILYSESIQSLFYQHRFDYVFHLAACAAEGLSHFIEAFNYQNNVIGSINLINASVNHDVKCFVFTSSIAVYGLAKLPMRESAPPDPEDSYGIANFNAGLELKATIGCLGSIILYSAHITCMENTKTSATPIAMLLGFL
jgi:UDP-glucose 4-epimerase